MKVAIFDLDNTLVDTETLKKYRDNGQWKEVFQKIPHTTTSKEVKDIISVIKNEKVDKSIIVTSSPSGYCKKVLEYHSFLSDLEIVGFHDTAKRKPSVDPYLKALSKLNLNLNDIKKIYIFGDEDKDFIAAETLKKHTSSNIMKIFCSWYINNEICTEVDYIMDKNYKKEQLNEIFG